MSVPQQSIHEIDSFIADSQHLILALPRSHPHRASIYSLATARFDRYKLSNQMDDLDKTILHLTESVLLQPWSLPGPKPTILLIFLNLAVALYLRSSDSGQPEDATYSAKYLRHLRDQPLETFGFPRSLVTLSLLDALAVRVKLDAGNVMQEIREMAVLCHELLASESDVSEGDTTHAVTLIYEIAVPKFRVGVMDQPLDQVIECLRAARIHKPDLRGVGFALVLSLAIRYFMTFVNDDYEEAASVMDEMTAFSPPDEESDDELAAIAQGLVTMLTIARSMVHQTPENSEEAIHRVSTTLNSAPIEKPELLLAKVLENTAKQRIRDFGSIECLEASSNDDDSPFSQPVVSVGGNDEQEPEYGLRKESKLLEGLLSKIRDCGTTTDIEEVIENGRAILASSDPRRPGPFTFHPFDLFGQILFVGFRRTKNMKYLDESISMSRRALEFPSAYLIGGPVIILSLALSFLTRFASLPSHCIQDLDEGLKLLSQGANLGHGSLPIRVQLASLWASYARSTQHSTVSAAYESALSLMQNALLFAPTLQLQHVILAKSFHHYHAVPLDYASYHIEVGRLKEATETLERGRALLWSEMRHLRASIDQVLQAHPNLAHKFAEVNRDLEKLTKSIPPSLDLNGADDLTVEDPFGRLLTEQRGLLNERNELISQIQALPGFDNFMTSPPFDTLCSAASPGPVILINHSSWRSDILILLHNTSPSLIPTPDNFFGRASALRDDLLDARTKHGPDSDHYNHVLKHVLKELYDLVGKPVIDRLRQLKVPEQSRVWWCPTSVFCSLPLHAMGPIPSHDGAKDERYFSDLYIPSYTPTLSALIPEPDHRESDLHTSDPLSLLLVAHFDVPLSPSEACQDVDVIQALNTRLRVTSLISEGATAISALDGLQDHQFVHFACHGTLEASKPFDAGFELHGNERLTLLDIVRSRAPTAEFAFLAACHTAEPTDGSSADEGLHLAAAVQYCGFRSVVGTMWAMADGDGPDHTISNLPERFETL